MTAWEYKLVLMGNPLQPGLEERANAFGREGWELVAIDAGVWIFKRPGRLEAEAPLQVLLEQTVPVVEVEAPVEPARAPAAADS